MRSKIVSSFAFVSIFYLASCSYYPESFDRSDFDRISETSKYIQLGSNSKTGLIFYPGGLVDPFAYVEFLNQIADEEVNVFVAKVPYNLSILDIDHAEGIRKAFPDIERWSLMGHSLGGTVACFEVSNNIDVYENLILLAAYPSESTDMSDYKGRTVSLYGSQDFVLNQEQLLKSKDQFSNVREIEDINNLDIQDQGTYFFEIVGGNHAQFGNYGEQNGDGEASISREVQQNIVISIVESLL